MKSTLDLFASIAALNSSRKTPHTKRHYSMRVGNSNNYAQWRKKKNKMAKESRKRNRH